MKLGFCLVISRRCLNLLFVIGLSVVTPVAASNVGVCMVATNKYSEFVPQLIDSARRFFLPDHSKTFFVFTNKPIELEGDDIVVVHCNHKVWPNSTLLRCEEYVKSAFRFKDMDYMFAIDADMLFVDYSGEILSERIATRHPGYLKKRGNFEERSRSTAYIPRHYSGPYFAGGFYGGSTTEFNKINNTLLMNIHKDTSQGITAKWHDESHLNKYFYQNPPTLTLTSSYCYPDAPDAVLDNPRFYAGLRSYKKILLALTKANRDAYRR